MVELAYSFHIGNDKNKTKKAKQKNTPTNYNNNAIQNAMQLSKVNHHNLRQYDNNPEKIKTLYGSNDIVKDVKELYKQEFEEVRLEYNSKQTRDDRKIKDYYSKISNDTKHDLAVEIIIELGDMDYWWDKDAKEMYKMERVYDEQVLYLKELVPDFKVANATIHFDESSPHLHIVGIAVKDNCKTGMSKQVGKCSVFTKDNLPKIQDKMRDKCIQSFNKEYGLNAVLKDKQKGRNIDYIEEVSKSTNDFKEITNYSLAVDKIKEDFEENHNSIGDLRKRVKAQNEQINDLRYDLDNKDKEISFLKSKIEDLKDSLDYWKDKFKRVVKFIYDKIHGIFGDKDDKYKELADNLFINGIMDEKEYTSVINKKEKNRDDFER